MDARQQEVVKSLIQMAWADGELSGSETRVLQQVLEKMGATPQEIAGLDDAMAGHPGPLAELDKVLPERQSRMEAMRSIMEMSFADGALSFKEFTYMERMANRLGLSDEDLEALRSELVG